MVSRFLEGEDPCSMFLMGEYVDRYLVGLEDIAMDLYLLTKLTLILNLY